MKISQKVLGGYIFESHCISNNDLVYLLNYQNINYSISYSSWL